MKFDKPFEIRIVKDRTGLSLQDNKMNSYETPLCYSKKKLSNLLWNRVRIMEM